MVWYTHIFHQPTHFLKNSLKHLFSFTFELLKKSLHINTRFHLTYGEISFPYKMKHIMFAYGLYSESETENIQIKSILKKK